MHICYWQYLARNGEPRDLDIEFNKLGSIISLPASQEAAASHPRGLQQHVPPRRLAPLLSPLMYQIARWVQGKPPAQIEVTVAQGKVSCWTRDACQSSLGKEVVG